MNRSVVHLTRLVHDLSTEINPKGKQTTTTLHFTTMPYPLILMVHSPTSPSAVCETALFQSSYIWCGVFALAQSLISANLP